MPLLHFLLALLVALTLSQPAEAAPRQEPSWPERFFAGRTEGQGEIRVLLLSHRGFRVQGRGALRRDGLLVLRQTLSEDGKPPASREWRLRRTGGDGLRGSLSDAEGLVEGTLSGAVLDLRYVLKGGYRVRQRMRLQPDGTTILNRLTVYRFGLPVARVAETIRKLR